MQTYEWGVDSAEDVTDELFQCVIRFWGYPAFWGRYLVRVPGISEGLSMQEISFIHGKGIKILPIYNSIREAIGYEQGKAAANDAVLHAQNLGMPERIPIFANVEQFFQIDAEWIRGWTEAIVANGYISGIYNDPMAGGFNQAFCDAVKINEWVKTLNILWSAQPESKPSGLLDPPYYMPKEPDCGGNVWAWQYSRNITTCPIDTNLAYSELVEILW